MPRRDARPPRPGVQGVITRLALAVATTTASGELRRLKACRHCRWVFHDTSKNRSGRWCSMAACGGRDKARSYRRRRALMPMTRTRVVVLAAAVVTLARVHRMARMSRPTDDRRRAATDRRAHGHPRAVSGGRDRRPDQRADDQRLVASALQFTDLRLEWEGLSDEAPYEPATLLGPGVTFDLRVNQGDAVCGTPPDARGAPPAGAGGRRPRRGGRRSAEAVAVPIEDRRSILPRVYRASCQAPRLAWAANLSFGDEWTPATTADGKPAVHRHTRSHAHESDAPLVITNIGGSVLLRISPLAPADPVLTLAPDQQAATIPILVQQSGNCAARAGREQEDVPHPNRRRHRPRGAGR